MEEEGSFDFQVQRLKKAFFEDEWYKLRDFASVRRAIFWKFRYRVGEEAIKKLYNTFRYQKTHKLPPSSPAEPEIPWYDKAK